MINGKVPCGVTMLFRVTLLTFTLHVLSKSKYVNCACVHPLHKSGSPQPCNYSGGRKLLRTAECSGTYATSICCIFPYPEKVQRSRHKQFQAAVKTVGLIDSSCIKLSPCERACKNAQIIGSKYDYPNVLPDGLPESKDLPEAYSHGERQFCYNNYKAYGNNEDQEDVDIYNGKRCQSDCNTTYSECHKQIQKSRLTDYFYESYRIFDDLGMWSFSATLLMRYMFVRDEHIKAPQAVRDSFEALQIKMAKMNIAFFQFVNSDLESEKEHNETEKGQNGTSVSNTKLQAPEMWERFLISYNDTEAELVDSVYESLSYSDFLNAIDKINTTLGTYDFGPMAYSMNDVDKVTISLEICVITILIIFRVLF